MSPYGTFTPEEWSIVKAAPMLAANLVVAADPSGPMGTMKEVMAAGKALSSKESAVAGDALVGAVLAEWDELTAKAKENNVSPMDLAKQEMLDVPKFNSADEMLAWSGKTLGEAAAVVTEKAPDDAAAFKQWVMDSAVAAANAAKEGSFLGIGGQVVSESEQAALDQIKGILGL